MRVGYYIGQRDVTQPLDHNITLLVNSCGNSQIRVNDTVDLNICQLAFRDICMNKPNKLVNYSRTRCLCPVVPARMHLVGIDCENRCPSRVVIGALELCTLQLISSPCPCWVWHVLDVLDTSFG